MPLAGRRFDLRADLLRTRDVALWLTRRLFLPLCSLTATGAFATLQGRDGAGELIEFLAQGNVFQTWRSIWRLADAADGRVLRFRLAFHWRVRRRPCEWIGVLRGLLVVGLIMGFLRLRCFLAKRLARLAGPLKRAGGAQRFFKLGFPVDLKGCAGLLSLRGIAILPGGRARRPRAFSRRFPVHCVLRNGPVSRLQPPRKVAQHFVHAVLRLWRVGAAGAPLGGLDAGGPGGRIVVDARQSFLDGGCARLIIEIEGV